MANININKVNIAEIMSINAIRPGHHLFGLVMRYNENFFNNFHSGSNTKMKQAIMHDSTIKVQLMV